MRCDKLRFDAPRLEQRLRGVTKMSRSQGCREWRRAAAAPSRGRGRPSHGGTPRAAASPGAPVPPPPQAQQSAPYPPQGYGEPQQGQPAACLPLSAAASVRRAGSRCPAGQPSGAEQPRQRAQCAADPRLRQPAHAAAGLCAAASAAARPGGAACRSRSDPCRRWISPDAAPGYASRRASVCAAPGAA